MELVGFLVLFPALVALGLLCARTGATRAPVVVGGVAVVSVAAIALAACGMGSPGFFAIRSEVVNGLCCLVDVSLCAVVAYYGVRHCRVLVVALAVVQAVCVLILEVMFAPGAPVAQGVYVDNFSLLMGLIIAVIGGGICVYALGYMQDFQHHQPEGANDRRPAFFALMFVFLGAMFFIVFSNNMAWMLTGWEVTTVCSFLLIGYTRTPEAIANSFRQIALNLVGGIAFTLALILAASQMGTLALDEFVALAVAYPDTSVLPVSLLGLAGLTKAAQMPFHTWLLGAMVAPTPTSALLHSSTMVKAGVFLLVKLAPCFAASPLPGLMVAFVGGVTFLLCSCMAIGQVNAKRVLAYSTIANLGLIAACAGIGTPETVWAAIFLILFHAVAKSLLFLCVGTIDHHVGSLSIEEMDNLFVRMPRLAKCMIVGVLCMFVAPFGMLVAKWATIAGIAGAGNIVMLLLVAFGSAATFMFWAKWLGKLVGVARGDDSAERGVHGSEWFAIGLMVVLCALCCAGLPLVSSIVVVPWIGDSWSVPSSALASGDLWLMAVLSLVVIAVVAGVHGRGGKRRRVGVYLSGVSVDNGSRVYRDALSGETEATARNWYLEGVFGERRWGRAGELLCGSAIVIAVFAPICSAFVGM